jgi:hypothetical protein
VRPAIASANRGAKLLDLAAKTFKLNTERTTCQQGPISDNKPEKKIIGKLHALNTLPISLCE